MMVSARLALSPGNVLGIIPMRLSTVCAILYSFCDLACYEI
jgi:hypothetical protein